MLLSPSFFLSAELDESCVSSTVPICTTTDTTMSAFKLINALCVGCVSNMITLQQLLTELFYSGEQGGSLRGLGGI